jgi:hypothetical protein
MSAVNTQQKSTRLNAKVDVIRFVPPVDFNKLTVAKGVVINNIMPTNRVAWPSAQFSFTNYHSLNFFTSPEVPSDSVFLYPNKIIDSTTGRGRYSLDDGFSFDFFIKPRYTSDLPVGQGDYTAGAILHLTGAYALTLHSGSSKDINGFPDSFRIGVQFGQDANIPPSELEQINQNLTFFSKDNSIPKNKWTHVSIRWGGPNYNFGTGSILINESFDTEITIDNTLNLGFYSFPNEIPAALCVGNYFEGTNNTSINPLSSQTLFFASEPALRDGIEELDIITNVNEPEDFAFTHPLNAEVHDLKIYNRYLTINEITKLRGGGPTILQGLSFYLPPFFTKESPFRQSVGTFGGILTTPFFERNGTTDAPFETNMAYSVGGHYINLENYVKDFASGVWPRLWALTGSATSPGSSVVETMNSFLYATGSNRKRAHTILPCDHGSWFPNFDLLSDLDTSRFISDLGNQELGSISLRNMLDLSGLTSTSIQTSGSILNETLGATPEQLGSSPTNNLAVFHRTRDNTSNQIVFFDISNLFYGKQIKPGSFFLRDSNLSGSGGKISITLKDDGFGNLYRADAEGSEGSNWASVGNVFYDEGIVLIKNPHLYFFGENEYQCEFSGTHNIHVLTINTFLRPNEQVGSSNTTFKITEPNQNVNDQDERFTYVSNVYLHDENLNVISRTNLAQPIKKRSSDKALLKIKIDF